MSSSKSLFPLLPLSLLVCTLAACSAKDAAEPAPASTATPPASVEAAPAPAAPRAAAPDASVPFTRYTRLDPDDERAVWLTYLVTAHSPDATSDEDLLNMFSPRYYNENDAFKKRELAATELPRIKETLAKFKAQRYYSLEFNRPGAGLGGINPRLYSVSAYDFDSRSFPVADGGCLRNESHTNAQSAGIEFQATSPAQCVIKVADPELARRIEALRVAQDLGLTGVLHFWIKQVDGNTLKAVVTGMHYALFDKRSRGAAATPLASADI